MAAVQFGCTSGMEWFEQFWSSVLMVLLDLVLVGSSVRSGFRFRVGSWAFFQFGRMMCSNFFIYKLL